MLVLVSDLHITDESTVNNINPEALGMLGAENFPRLREDARASLTPPTEFAASVESPAYGVLARHGHEWDEHTHGWRFRREVLMPSRSGG
jgi:hypothetical protein